MKEIINFNIVNTTNGLVPVSLLGNNADQMDTANATTSYVWNIGTFVPTTENQILIEYKNTGALAFTTTTVSLSEKSTQGIINALNTLNLGFFFATTSGGNTFINNYNQNIVFGIVNVFNSAVPQQVTYSLYTTSIGGDNNIFQNAVSQLSVLNPTVSNGIINAVNGDTILYSGTTPASNSFDIFVSSPSLPYNIYQIYAAAINLPFSYSFITANFYDYLITIQPAQVWITTWQLFFDWNTSDVGGSNNFDVNFINVVSDANPIVSNSGFPFSAGDAIDFYGTTPSVAGYNVTLTNYSTGVIEYQILNAPANTPYSYSFVAVLGNVYTASVSL